MKTRNFAARAALILFATAMVNALAAADEPRARRFEWLSGHWCSEAGGQRLEEFWLPAEGELALGVGRTVKTGKTTTFEFMRIETRDGVTNYISLHDGQPPVEFGLTASGEQWARFENPQHDFPKRVEYRRTSSGLHAEIAGPGKDGKQMVISFEYRRCRN